MLQQNGSTAPLPSASPTSSPNRPSGRSSPPSRRLGLFLGIGGAGAILLLALAVIFLFRFTTPQPYTGPTWTVVKERLRVTIVERGSLESAENSDIICRVKAKSQGSTVASTIKWVVDDGKEVKPGDPLIELDDSGFQENLKTQRNKKNEYHAKWIEAKTNCVIVASENESLIKTAEVNRDLAELNLKKYVGNFAGAKVVGMKTREELQKYLRTQFENDVRTEVAASDNRLTSKFAQTLSEIEGKIENARSDRELWLDKASWSMRMVQKGFYSRSQADSDQSRLASMEIALRKVQAELDIFRRFDLEGDVTDLWSKLTEADRALTRVKTQAVSKMEKARADDNSQKSIYDQELARLEEMENEKDFYHIVAKQAGMVVYFVPEQSRSGSGTQQGIVAQGEPVREGQKLIRIPNLNKMLVNVRVHEALASKVKEDQQAFIRIDAYPGKAYRGNVRSVATIASSGDFFSSDIKVYPTMVSISSAADNLKPGMSAEVTILANETDEPVLVAPIQAVVGNISMGAKRKCYVLDPAGIPQERDIVVGLSNDKLVQVISGLEEGDKVVQNPSSLIPEKSGMKPGTPSTRRGTEFDDPGAGGKKGKKGAGKGGALPEGKSFQTPPDAIRPQERVPGKKQ